MRVGEKRPLGSAILIVLEGVEVGEWRPRAVQNGVQHGFLRRCGFRRIRYLMGTELSRTKCWDRRSVYPTGSFSASRSSTNKRSVRVCLLPLSDPSKMIGDQLASRSSLDLTISRYGSRMPPQARCSRRSRAILTGSALWPSPWRQFTTDFTCIWLLGSRRWSEYSLVTSHLFALIKSATELIINQGFMSSN